MEQPLASPNKCCLCRPLPLATEILPHNYVLQQSERGKGGSRSWMGDDMFVSWRSKWKFHFSSWNAVCMLLCYSGMWYPDTWSPVLRCNIYTLTGLLSLRRLQRKLQMFFERHHTSNKTLFSSSPAAPADVSLAPAPVSATASLQAWHYHVLVPTRCQVQPCYTMCLLWLGEPALQKVLSHYCQHCFLAPVAFGMLAL